MIETSLNAFDFNSLILLPELRCHCDYPKTRVPGGRIVLNRPFVPQLQLGLGVTIEKITERNTRPTAFHSHFYSTESLSCTI